MFKTYETELAGRKLVIETGKMAGLANGSVLVRYGDTCVLVNVTASKEPREGIDFFPLSVDFEEKLYSVGKIPGGFLKREGKPSEHSILSAREIDRTLRPLFAEGFRNEVQIVNTVMSADPVGGQEMAAMFGSSLCTSISKIPFDGPIAGVKVGRVDGEFVINPTPEQMEKSDIDLTVAGTKEAINMVESSAKEVSEDDMLEALMFGHDAVKELCEFQEEIVNAIGVPKMEYEHLVFEEELVNEISYLSIFGIYMYYNKVA